jgi:hypothetical protein
MVPTTTKDETMNAQVEIQEERRGLLGPTASIAYLYGGKGKLTLVGRSARYTFKLSRSDDDSLIFVKVLVGSDNENSYEYIGFMPRSNLNLTAGRKGNAEHPAFKALEWYIGRWKADDDERIAQAQFWHEGTCGRCGRALTVPSSIQMGLGPTCAGRLD